MTRPPGKGRNRSCPPAPCLSLWREARRESPQSPPPSGYTRPGYSSCLQRLDRASWGEGGGTERVLGKDSAPYARAMWKYSRVAEYSDFNTSYPFHLSPLRSRARPPPPSPALHLQARSPRQPSSEGLGRLGRLFRARVSSWPRRLVPPQLAWRDAAWPARPFAAAAA
jgi:hypothetical protein